MLLPPSLHRLAGSYEALSGGQTGDALVDFSGGVNEAINMRDGGYKDDQEKQLELFDNMYKAHEHDAMLSCSIAVSREREREIIMEIRGWPPGI